MIQITFEYSFGDSVYIKTDPNQMEHQITGFTVRPAGILYGCSVNGDESWHYNFELSNEQDMVKKTA